MSSVSLYSNLAFLGAALGCLCAISLRAQSLRFIGNPGFDFGEVNVCRPGAATPSSCGRTITLNYQVTASGTLGAIRVVTQGDANLDFTLASGSTCAGSIFQGNTCTVNVKFRPKFPGWRPGAVLLTDASGSVLSKTFINGYGTGPQIGFVSTSAVPIPFTGLKECIDSQDGGCLLYSTAFCENYAIDGAGNIFAVCLNPSNEPFQGATIVVELPADGGPQVTLPFSGLLQGEGLALNGAGDLFVLDVDNLDVLELPAGGGPQVSIPIVSPMYDNPSGLAVDGKGNLYTANSNGNKVFELPASGGQITLPFITGLAYPAAVAVDYFGDVFTAAGTPSDANGAVVELPAGGPPQKTLFAASGSISIGGTGAIAIDGVGDLFFTYAVGEGVGFGVFELPSGSSIPIDLIGNQFATGLAVSPSGNLFFLGGGNGSANMIQRSRSAPLNFGSIPVGTSKILPLAITNTGNRPLSFTPYYVSPSYKILGEAPAGCQDGLAPAATCTLQIKFTALTEGRHNIALTLSGNGASDSTILLAGTGTN